MGRWSVTSFLYVLYYTDISTNLYYYQVGLALAAEKETFPK